MKSILHLLLAATTLGTSGLAATLTIRNPTLVLSLDSQNGALSVMDQRTSQRLEQKPLSKSITVTDAAAKDNQFTMQLRDAATGIELAGTVQLDPKLPEFTFELSGQGALRAPVKFPHPFVSQPGQYLVIPMNEGISYPVEDKTINPLRLIAYGGHGICMAFWGATDGRRGYSAILETPDDAAIRIDRLDGNLTVAPEWESQRQQFGYARRLRYVFFDQGGHVAIAKRYRAYTQKIGLFKTLEQKRKENPNVDLLIGAVNVWCWEKDAVPLVKEMQAAGIERILWSNGQGPEGLKAMNQLKGVLASRYDIYQDCMNPEKFPLLRGTHSDWTSDAWPHDLMLKADGDWVRGWEVTAKDGSRIPCGVLCDRRAPDYARKRIPADLATHPYRARFIDTTTASPWRECYSTNHPMTRTDSKRSKMELLRYVSEDNKLVTGCETGHDASVPFLHFYEGMLSLGQYRVPDSGRDMRRIWTDVPERVAKFQLGHDYRLPLWELVYHDCVVAQWYWGDYNNKLPALWDKRDLFNLLYGTGTMFMFDRKLWEQDKARFVQSYKNTCPHIRKVGYQEMTGHRFLTPDRTVQQTTFANGVTFTVNFGDKPFRLQAGLEVAPMGFQVAGTK